MVHKKETDVNHLNVKSVCFLIPLRHLVSSMADVVQCEKVVQRGTLLAVPFLNSAEIESSLLKSPQSQLTG